MGFHSIIRRPKPLPEHAGKPVHYSKTHRRLLLQHRPQTGALYRDDPSWLLVYEDHLGQEHEDWVYVEDGAWATDNQVLQEVQHHAHHSNLDIYIPDVYIIRSEEDLRDYEYGRAASEEAWMRR